MEVKRDVIEVLRELATDKGLKIFSRSNGHVQVRGGPLVVNWYPLSKNKTAYVAKTKKGVTFATPEKVISMCFDAPPITRVTLKRRKRNRNGPDFKKLWDRQNGMCFVCGKPMTNTHDIRDSLRATFEHVVPLARGGLDNFINLALSHKRCNNERGHDMPELMKP